MFTMERDFENFQRLVLEDHTLQEVLRRVSDQDAFIARVVTLGHERGYTFSEQDVRTALNAGRRSWLERWI